jgi:hypothetical protein
MADLKINRIKRENTHLFNVLEDALNSQELVMRSPDMRKKMAAVRERQAMIQSMDTLTKFTRAGNFDPTRTFQLVANNVDPAVWRVILDTFARIDPVSGEPMDDGLLYKTDPKDGEVKLNKDFFYALLAGPLKSWDSRGKIIV